MLLKRVRPQDAFRAKAEDGLPAPAQPQETLPHHEPIISRWSGATCMAFQPSTDSQQYLVGEPPDIFIILEVKRTCGAL